MREIKFRVWSKESKKMYLPKKGCDFLVRIDGEYFVDEDILENVGLIPVKRDGYVLMQYTGLKDKNGKEIYEGDIVGNFKCHKSFIPLDMPEYMEIYWFNEAYAYWGRETVETKENYDYDLTWADWYDFEVIGNIYENPDKLNK